MSPSKMLAILGLVLAIVDFAGLNAILESFADRLIKGFNEITNDKTRKFAKSLNKDKIYLYVTASVLISVIIAMASVFGGNDQQAHNHNSIFGNAVQFVITLVIAMFFISLLTMWHLMLVTAIGFLLHFFKFIMNLMNKPAKGFLGSLGLLLAVIGVFL